MATRKKLKEMKEEELITVIEINVKYLKEIIKSCLLKKDYIRLKENLDEEDKVRLLILDDDIKEYKDKWIYLHECLKERGNILLETNKLLKNNPYLPTDED